MQTQLTILIRSFIIPEFIGDTSENVYQVESYTFEECKQLYLDRDEKGKV